MVSEEEHNFSEFKEVEQVAMNDSVLSHQKETGELGIEQFEEVKDQVN